ncbi:MAG: hypothetical protein K9M17_03870 [Mariprofundaceae bacterium]|nr:hypothetical protein [Mariprofundaceae bacterium]
MNELHTNLTFERPRKRMVAEQLVPRGVDDPRVLEAMSIVPRHLFVDPALSSHA